MTDDLQQLTDTGYAWMITRGRTRRDEPIYGVGLGRVDANGLSTGEDFAFMVEGDDLHACVIRCVAWAERQRAEAAP